MQWDSLWLNANLATLVDATGYGIIEDGALATKDGKIVWVGPRNQLPEHAQEHCAVVHDVSGQWITPGLIDCHTHLVYAGQRAAEFEQRLQGASYAQIAQAGGGIRATLTATRAANEAALLQQSLPRLQALMNEGVTTVEIKSGYGLDTQNECKQLRVARALGKQHPINVQTTFLGAHALPPEFSDDTEGYVDYICQDMLPAAHDAGLVDAVDAFCEHIGFNTTQVARVFDTAQALGLPVKLHAEQLSDSHGAALAARYQALSADHLEYLSLESIQAMAASKTTAVLLPGAFYFLGETKLPPITLLREHGIPMAIASDCNPGSSPSYSLLLIMNMACLLFGLTPCEALAGVTREAARALGLGQTHGQLKPGYAADLTLWDIETPAQLAYGMGNNPCRGRVLAGTYHELIPPRG